MRYLLDNDTSSLALRGHARLKQRLTSTPNEDIWLSGIAVEEMLSGALAAINTERSRPKNGFLAKYQYLIEITKYLSLFNILPYDDEAEKIYQSMTPAAKRAGANDCRTAALAIEHSLIVVTCNGKDFSRIPDVKFEDWTK